MKRFALSLVCGLALTGGAVAAALPRAASPEAEGVSSRRVAEWLDAVERQVDCLHGFVFLRHGKVVAEGSWKPFDTLNEPHRLSSHSKCFITTAVGFLVEEGRLDLDEYVVDILPDKAPAKPSENLKRVRVRDLLTMNYGAKREHWRDDLAGDWAKAQLAAPLPNPPGRSFKYDSGATHLLGLIVQRKSGRKLMDFLKERLFDRIGIEKAWTTYCPMGEPCAAWGFSMTTREIARIGQLYLNGGTWDGTRLFSAEWAKLATAKQTWSGLTPTEFQPKNDWTYGFGFNWWCCQHGCYRADGSGGQYTIVFPRHDAVLSIHADVEDMQVVLDTVWEKFLPALAPAALPEDVPAAAALKARCAALNLPPVAGRREGGTAFLGRAFAIKSGPVAVRGLQLDRAADGWTLRMTTAAGRYELPVGFGAWKKSQAVFSDKSYEALGDLVGVQRLAASAAVQDDDSIKVRLHVLGGPRRMDFHFRKKLFKPGVDGTMAGMGEKFR